MPRTTATVPDAVLEAAVRGLWLFITGTGRCGTGYLSQVLTSIGVNCTHEGVFNPNWADDPGHPPVEELRRRVRLNQDNAWWGWQAEASWLAAPYLDIPELEGCTVVQLTRHPKPTIDSNVRMGAFGPRYQKYTDFQLQFLPDLLDYETIAERAAYYYVRWNQMIEPYADIRWRVEDSTIELLDRLGLDWKDKPIYGNKRYNTRGWDKKSDVDLDGLPEPLRSELQEITERYGYEWPVAGSNGNG